MQRLFVIFLLSIGVNLSTGQDIRIQEPVKNFDQLWNEFNDRYAFFELKGIDWHKSYKKYRPLINQSTTNDSLFSVCEQMLNELKDGHVTLVQYNNSETILRENVPAYKDYLRTNFPITKERNPNIYQLVDLIDTTLSSFQFSKYVGNGEGLIKYKISPNYGYLTIRSMQNQSKNKFKKVVDEAVKAFKDKKGVIIDIRFNGGGFGDVSFAIAGRFTDQKRIAHYVKERKPGTNDYTKFEITHTKPLGKVQFTKPIILITSDWTASAAEEFTLAMKELPYVTIVGDNTDGSFSDRFDFTLPNKWQVSLSHQQYFDAEMNNYEGVGVTPHIKLLNKPEDILNGMDPLIVKAIEILDEKTAINK